MNVNDKIKQILIDKSLSPSVFADEIGVQRSSISHILSGRNRPSFDIIQKVIRRFPDLGYDWIMEDDNQESQYTTRPTSVRPPSETSYNSSYQRESTLKSSPRFQSRNDVEPKGMGTEKLIVATPISPASVPEKTVERILIFYTDGTFREYTPATTGSGN